MKKNYLFIVSFLLLFLIFFPEVIEAGLVPCGNPGQPDCTIEHFFILLNNIYNFIVWNIATPLAILMITISGVMILVSAGNPSLFKRGTDMLWITIIGLVLVFGAWVIINFIMTALGYDQGPWNVLDV